MAGATETILRHMHEICPFRIGSRVRVKQDSRAWTSDWQGIFVIVLIEWDYRRGRGDGINIGIASDDEIEHRLGYTDDFHVDDLEPAP